MKYDKIVSISQAKSREKVKIAKREIQNLLERTEKITVAALVRNTGFSKALFYDNDEVRMYLDDAFRKQGACYNPKQVIIDRVMEKKLEMLKTSNIKLKKENEKLRYENFKLREENAWLREK